MQFRRRWNASALVVTLLASSVALAATVPAGDVPSKFETAKGMDAVTAKDEILKAAPTAIRELNDYANAVGDALIRSKIFTAGTNPDGQLNAAILVVRLGTISSQNCLEEMLTSPNAAVRYWAAKGLANIAPPLMSVGGGGLKRATGALNAALAKEPSTVVKAQIARALAAFATSTNVDPLIDAMKALAGAMQSSFPDRETLDVTAGVVKNFATLAKTAMLSKEQKAAAAEALANISSFAIQQEFNKPESERPVDYHTGVLNVVNNSLDALNQVIGKAAFSPIRGDVEATYMLVGASVGSASAGGDLQKLLPGVPLPPNVAKAPAPK